MIRFLAERGEFGPVDDMEAKVRERLALILRPGGSRYERRTATGRYIEFDFRHSPTAACWASIATSTLSREEALARKEAAEAARAEESAPRRPQPGQVDLPRHHEPRDPHADERRARHDGRAGAPGARRPAAAHASRPCASSAQALLRIIDDVLDFSKIEAGRLELEETAFSLSGLIDGVVGTFRPQALAKGLALDVAIDAGSDDALVGDPTRVRQILFNLLGNALKFTERGGVQVRAGTAPLGQGATARHARGHRHRHRARPQSSARACSSRSRRPTARPRGGSAAPASACRSCAGWRS